MPEFVLDKGPSPDDFDKLDDFVQGYVEAMFFTETGTGDDDDNELEHAHFGELARDALLKIIADCEAFQQAAAETLERAYERGYAPEQAGRDFWYTRNGHGTGFWDRDELGELGTALTEGCGFRTQFGEVYVYRGDDGLIYI